MKWGIAGPGGISKLFVKDLGFAEGAQLDAVAFGFDIGWQPESRLLDPDLGGGALLDAGIYPVSFASMVFGTQPVTIKSSARIGATGVDEQFSLPMEYEGGKTDSYSKWSRSGTKGYIHIPMFLFGRSASLHVKGEETMEFALSV